MSLIYLDFAATTPTDPRVIETMLPFFYEQFGNAASRTHAYGWSAEKAVKQSRQQIADLINSKPEDIIFTSGSTESINFCLKGVFEANANKGNHMVTVSTEHKAVIDTCKHLEKKGAKITFLSVNDSGLIDLEKLEQSITTDTILVSIMYANNETGVIQPIKEIADIVHNKGAYFMTDATQALGKIPINVIKDNIDILCFSGHKLYGPKGIGGLYIKTQYPKINITPLLHGGGHERGWRSGTLNVPAIVGLGKACEICKMEMQSEGKQINILKNKLEKELLKLDSTKVHSINVNRLPNISNICFKEIDAEALVMSVRDKLAIASGSACTSAEVLPSHVLMAMCNDEDIADSSIRISLGRYTQEKDIDETIIILKKAIDQLKAFNI